MTESTALSESAGEMEALFDSIVSEGNTVGNIAVSTSVAAEGTETERSAGSNDALLNRVGHLTRTLHESLNALGYDKVIEKTAAAIPDAKDRLAYVVTMTEKAADRTLNATDAIKPIQDDLALGANQLTEQWDSLFARELSIEQFKLLVADTRCYLGEVPRHTGTTNAQLMEIMMAQDFQDLTGQVIKRTTEIIQTVERELLQLLLENIAPERRLEVSDGLLNGPVINSDGRSDVVTSQDQVDDLLESLGF